ncbi:hypothetical protein [Dyella terrae]|uniref:hypothetical protein n=1 Tax=Dyella terrae TaxID=522259 RepID=UPI001EFD8771|nr:hypothetical protein [Dyella terrae]ULU23168.1 hypothetical protein DYST_00059 [Dyella terrae]
MLMIKQFDDEQRDDEASWAGHLSTWHDYVQVRKLLESYGPYRFFLTLSFNYELSDHEGQEALAKLWRRLMKKVLGKRWISKGVKPMTGVAVLEKAQIFAQSTREFGSCHFHLLVHHHPHLSEDDLIASITLLLAFADAAKQLTHKNRRWQLVSKHGVSLKIIGPGESPSFVKYVAKEALRHGWKWDERVFYLGKDGI